MLPGAAPATSRQNAWANRICDPIPPSDQTSPLKAWVRALEMTTPIERNPSMTLPLVIETLADRFGDALALTDGLEHLTYKGLAQTPIAMPDGP